MRRQALLFPPPREARASPYAGKIGTGDEASVRTYGIRMGMGVWLSSVAEAGHEHRNKVSAAGKHWSRVS